MKTCDQALTSSTNEAWSVEGDLPALCQATTPFLTIPLGWPIKSLDFKSRQLYQGIGPAPCSLHDANEGAMSKRTELKCSRMHIKQCVPAPPTPPVPTSLFNQPCLTPLSHSIIDSQFSLNLHLSLSQASSRSSLSVSLSFSPRVSLSLSFGWF